MKLAGIFFILILTTLTACNWGGPNNTPPAITKDTLTYQYNTLKQRADNCGTMPDSNCTVIRINYPVFAKQPKLNDSVRRRAISLFSVYQQPDTNFKRFATRFMKAYKHDMANRNHKINYMLQTTARVIRQDSDLVTIQLSGYTFQGGAHGSSLTTFINWNIKTQRYLTLKDILIDNYQPGLDTVAEKIFRKEEKLGPNDPLKPNYFFANNKFALNNNYLITPVGIRFLYNEYEIKPYAAGQTELFIPYSQITSLLRPNTVVAQYHN